MSTIKDLCEKYYDKWIYDCSGFLKAVAKDLGITLTGMANNIIDFMGSSPSWRSLGNDADAAVRMAGQRYLVVAGLKAAGHGHVVIIMPGAAKPYPTAYWGSISHHPGRNKTINWAWTRADLANVSYFATPIPSPVAYEQ